MISNMGYRWPHCPAPDFCDIDIALSDDAVERHDDRGIVTVLLRHLEQVLLRGDVRLGDRDLPRATANSGGQCHLLPGK